MGESWGDNGRQRILMAMQSTIKWAFRLYNLAWGMIIPVLRYHHRLTEGFMQRTLTGYLPKEADLWIQAASVGEAYLAWQLLKQLRPRRPLRVILTSNTSQGIEILKQAADELKAIADKIDIDVNYFPFDKPVIMQKAVRQIGPKVMILLETELWPGLLLALKTYGCKILIINGRLTAKSLKRYLIWSAPWRLLKPDRILAISKTDALRFATLFGKENVVVMPNIKFDRITACADIDSNSSSQIKKLLPPNAPLVTIGSIRHAEGPFVKKIISEILRRRTNLVIGLFPRHLHRIAYWENTLNRLGSRWFLRSKTQRRVPPGSIILWDTVGELPEAYRFSKAAFVGGSLAPLGGQNFLEALVSGIIPIIGPSWENFAWVGPQIISSGLLRVAQDWKETARLLLEDIDQPRSRQAVLRKALQYVKARQGGTSQACRHIQTYLENFYPGKDAKN